MFGQDIELIITIGATAIGLGLGLYLVTTAYMIVALRAASKERTELSKELYGLVRRIEGLTATRREQMLKHYDGLLESLTNRLPPAIASQTSNVIFETESKILNRLAELEPNLKNDAGAKKKMDELIKSMELLERTIINLTADAVRNVMVEGRRSLIDEADFDGRMAA